MEQVEQTMVPTRLTGLSGDGRTRATGLSLNGAILLSGIVAVAAVLRFGLLGHNSLWFDEAYMVRITLFPWRTIPALLKTAELHPPLDYLLMKAWIAVAGFGEAAIRVPSACFSVGAVVLTYAVVRRVASDSVGLLSAFLVGVSPFAVMAGQDAKMYALLSALTLASTLALVEAGEGGGIMRWGAYILVTTLMLYTHYLGLLIVFAQGLGVAWVGRSHLGKWLFAAMTVAVLFAPWAPFVRTQMTHVPTTAMYDPATLQDLSQLLGLFAFGGSLLGMPSFFFRNTSLTLLEQIVLLLPFILVTWTGARAFARNGGRRAAILALSLVVPIGVAFTAALARPPFEARWFSFLLPFYAALLARGIVDVAEHFRDHQRQIAAGLTAGLLLYSVPVFAHYYFDSHFRPYQWREAAALVRSRAGPGDLFVYGDYQNELAFTYYFGATPAEVLLLPKQDVSAIRGLAARYPRMWLIVAPPVSEATLTQTLEGLKGAYTSVGRSGFDGRGVFPVIFLLKASKASP
jgi:4-amino-4-deoxy-L-arabinose transferase-like glycosyltransferase